MESYQPDLLVRIDCDLGEGIFWDPASKYIYWTDINRGRLFRCDANGKHVEKKEVNLMTGAFTLTTVEGVFLLATEDGFMLYNWNREELFPLINPEESLPANRFNDGKCDPAGRFWAGTMARDTKGRKGSLYCLDSSTMKPRRVAENIGISNGLAWDTARSVFYYIDSSRQEVMAFDYEEDGSIRNRRICISIPDDDGSPDGMTIDEEGMLWVAHWNGFQVARWNPITGEKLATITLPVPLATCCCFGGDELRTLYISSAHEGFDEDRLKEFPESGSVFSIRLPVGGLAVTPFSLGGW